MKNCLTETYYYNFNNTVVQDVLKKIKQNKTKKEQAIELYLLVRNKWRYNPLVYHIEKEHFK